MYLIILVKLMLQSIDVVANVQYEYEKSHTIIVDEIVQKHKQRYKMDTK